MGDGPKFKLEKTMNTYAVKVIMPNGMWIDIQVKAGTYDQAKQVAMNMYGPGCSIGGCTQIDGPGWR